MPVSEEGVRHGDLHQPGAPVVLLDGLGVPLVLAEGVEVLQGYRRLHRGRKVQGEESAQEGQQGSRSHLHSSPSGDGEETSQNPGCREEQRQGRGPGTRG